MGRLGRIGLEPVRRYERSRPGELLHVDVKKLGRIKDGAGHRIHGGLQHYTGRFTDAQHHCIYANSLIFDKGQFVFTAADGDLLVGSYYGDLVPADNTGVLFEVQGHWVISGGTGRFANATGSGLASGPLNSSTGLVNLELVGTISRPGGRAK